MPTTSKQVNSEFWKFYFETSNFQFILFTFKLLYDHEVYLLLFYFTDIISFIIDITMERYMDNCVVINWNPPTTSSRSMYFTDSTFTKRN